MLRLLILFIAFAMQASYALASETKLHEWAILVYLDGQDQHTCSNAEAKARRLEAIGSTDKVSILLETSILDRNNPGAEKTAGRYFLKKSTDTYHFSSKPDEEIKNADMQNMKELASFIKWAKKNYPAKKYMLLLWTRHYDMPLRCPGCYLYRENLKASETADAIREAGGIDVLGIDSDGLQSAEWLYEFDGAARYAVGSVDKMLLTGYNFEDFFEKLNDNPGSNPKKAAEYLAKAFVSEIDRLSSSGQPVAQGYAQSVADLSKMKALKKKTDYFAAVLKAEKDKRKIKELLNNSLVLADGNAIELCDFAKAVTDNGSDKKIVRAAKALISQINKTVILNLAKDNPKSYWVKNLPLSRSCGISVSLPKRQTDSLGRSWSGGSWDSMLRQLDN